MRKILIIEDEPNIRELVSYNLKAGGFVPIEAEDGISGMEMVETKKPDLILLDIMLPGAGGVPAAARLSSMDMRFFLLSVISAPTSSE